MICFDNLVVAYFLGHPVMYIDVTLPTK